MLSVPVYKIKENSSTNNNNNGDISVLLGQGVFEEQKAFVESIFQAAKIDVASRVCFYRTEKEETMLCRVQNIQDTSFVVVFGLSAKDIGLQADITKYKSYTLEQTKIVFADAIQHFLDEKQNNKNRPLAKALWGAIKTMFSL